MILSHKFFSEKIDFNMEKSNVLIVENNVAFRKLIECLYNQIYSNDEGEFLLSENLNELSMSKKADILIDFFTLDLNNRKFLNEIYKQLELIGMNEFNYYDTQTISLNIENYLTKLTEEINCSLLIEEITLSQVIKASNIKFNYNIDDIKEKILIYMDLSTKLLGKDLFILVNIQTYLNDVEIELLNHEISLKKYNVLFIENTINRNIKDSENVILLDSDLCELINTY